MDDEAIDGVIGHSVNAHSIIEDASVRDHYYEGAGDGARERDRAFRYAELLKKGTDG